MTILIKWLISTRIWILPSFPWGEWTCHADLARLYASSEAEKVVDWNAIDKDEYLNAMKRSAVSTGELKYLLLNNQTDDLTQARFFKGVDASYYYEG